MEKSDDKLIFEYLQGNKDAFNIIVTRHLKSVLNFAYRVTGSRDDAEDISQETFLKLWKNLKNFDPTKKFRTWLFTIARNSATDLLRKRRGINFSDLENEDGKNPIESLLIDDSPIPEELLIRAERKKSLDKLLAKLSPIYRELLLLRYTEDFNFEEIAHILQKPSATIRTQHKRAITKLRTLLADETI